MTDVICSGWLSIDSKRRWVLLKDLYIYFYGDQPTDGKNMNNLKGLLYLPHAMVQAAPGRTAVFILVCKDRTHTFSTSASELAGEEAEKYLVSWKNTLEYVIERAQVFKTQPTIEGWLHKKGGRGHEFKNTKKRYFVLRGNMLGYYSSPRKSEDDISSLKGFIELAQIGALNSNFSERHVEFSVQTNGGREYILIAKDVTDKARWIDGIKHAATMLAQLQFAVALGVGTEEVIRTGKMSRITAKATHSYYFALTSSNLRFYSADFGSVPSLVSDFGRNLVACIPLLGANVEHDPATNTLSVLDVTGNSYLFSSKSSDELRKWEEDISVVSKELARQIIRQKGVIRLNTYILPEQPEQTRSKGYCVITVSSRAILFNFLMLRRDITVPWRSLRAVDMIGDDIFCLKYKRDGEMKQLNIRSRNACGLYDTIEAVQEELTENPQDESEEEKPGAQSKSVNLTAPLAHVDSSNPTPNQADSSVDFEDQARRLSTTESGDPVAFYDIDNLPARSRTPSLSQGPASENSSDVVPLPQMAAESSDRTDPSGSSTSALEVVEDAGSDSEDPAIPSLPSTTEFHRILSKKNSGLGTDSSDTAATTDEDSPRVARKQSSQSVDSGDIVRPKKSRLNKKKKKAHPVQKTTSADALPL